MGEPLDTAAREQAVLAPGSVLVQAPAGSGKTTLLAQRYLRLLAQVDAPERILALTFTRRAAQEMRDRVLQALGAAGGECPPDMNVRTWQLGHAAERRMSDLNLDVVRHPARLRIETIDAFNAWLAAQLPVTAGAGSRLNLTDNAHALYEEAARRALKHEEQDAFAEAVERVLEQADQRWDRLVGLISDMLPGRERWLPLLAGHLKATVPDAAQLLEVRRRFDEDLRLLVERVLIAGHAALGGERLAALSRLMHAAALRTPEPAAAAWRRDASVLRADAGDIDRWRALAALLLTRQGAFRLRFNRTQGFPPGCSDKGSIVDVVEELARLPHALRTLAAIRALPDPEYRDAQWVRVRDVAQILVLAAAHLDQLFRERGTADFPAVSMAALRALGGESAPSDLGLRLDYRLQHILIDEFQDTSGAQLDLVKLLTAGWQRDDGRSVFCVGDPMQSIYGFRQAEVRAFLELAEAGIGEVRFDAVKLSSNFRSAKPLVEWINRCFSRILPPADDRDRGAIAFRPSASAARVADGQACGVDLRGFAGRRQEAEGIAALIAAQISRHPEWRIAVLVRARAHARDIAQSLRSRAVPFRAVDIELMRDRAAVRDLTALISALSHLGDRTAWLALLRAPWTGLNLADLLRVAHGAPLVWDALADDAVLASLSEEGRARCLRVRGVLDQALRRRTQGNLARRVEQAWLALGGASVADLKDLAQVATVLRRLRELERQGLPDAAGLAAAFDDLFVESDRRPSVEIMTIHKAKGLEFDLVVVPALDRAIHARNDEMLLTHQFARARRDGMVMAARPGIGADADPLFDFLREQSRDSAALEAQRLLYVACTRAKRRLHLTAVLEAAPAAGSLLEVLWPVVGGEFTGAAAAGAPQPAKAPRGGPLLRVPAGWSPPLEEVLHDVGEVPAPTMPRAATPVFDWAGETARRVGSLVHAELQVLDLERSNAETVLARTAHFRRRLTHEGVPAELSSEAAERVAAALLAVHGDSRARWILKRWPRYDVREHALSAYRHHEIVRVVFDRSFIDDTGVRWVIDYKTSRHAGGRLEEFLDREVERYRPQMQRYADIAGRLGPEPVRVGLYFPLMRAWREWAPQSNGNHP